VLVEKGEMLGAGRHAQIDLTGLVEAKGDEEQGCLHCED